MKATIKKVKDGRWFVTQPDKDVTAVFPADEHDKAIKLAYDNGCDEFEVVYSSRVKRVYARSFVESKILSNV